MSTPRTQYPSRLSRFTRWLAMKPPAPQTTARFIDNAPGSGRTPALLAARHLRNVFGAPNAQDAPEAAPGARCVHDGHSTATGEHARAARCNPPRTTVSHVPGDGLARQRRPSNPASVATPRGAF